MAGRGRALLLAVTVSLTSGCAARFVARPPSPENEVARLKREITKVRFAIDATKELIERSRGQAYLADLYLRLAELYVEEARYHYFIAYEGQKRRSKAVDAVQPKLLKNQAISVYRRILDEYPNYKLRDKVLFYIAHEYRELGEYSKMLAFLRRVVDEHPKSVYRNEALLVLGDHHFDRNELRVAGQFYRKIIAGPESATHGMARYKLAWVRINHEDYRGALKLFEGTIKGLEERKGEGGEARTGARIDLRREALVDMVYPYTEVHKRATSRASLRYFKGLADSRTTYLAALSKLARRLFVKEEYQRASGVYRELLVLGSDGEDSIEWARRLYDGAVKGRQHAHVATDVAILVDVVRRRIFDWRLGEKERKQIYDEFEVYARDLATKTQLAASGDDADSELLERAADAYASYLEVFDLAEKAPEIRQNLAECRFAARQYVLAGNAYQALLGSVNAEDLKSTLQTTVSAYAKALEKPWKLTRVDTVRARAGLRTAARRFIGAFGADPAAVAVKFNLARSYYDEGDLVTASDLFAALTDQYPKAREAAVSAELALDALRVSERFEDMAALGGRLSSDERLPVKLRQELAAIVKSAESRALERATLEAGYKDEAATDALLEFANRHRGSALGERALVNAFATARNSDDLDEVARIGQRLIKEYPRSPLVSDVLATLGKMSAQATDFVRAAEYLEDAAEARKKDDTAVDLLRASMLLKAHMRDFDGAEKAYRRVLRRSRRPGVRRDAVLAYSGLLEQTGDYRRLARALQLAVDAGVTGVTIDYRLGYALLAGGFEAQALPRLQDAARAGASSSAPEDRQAGAAATYYLARPLYDGFAAVDGQGATVTEAIQEKFATLATFEDAMYDVLKLQDPRWAIAALADLARAYALGAEFLRSASPPDGLDAESQARFRGALDQKVATLEAKAKEARDACVSKATELEVFTRASRSCLAGTPYDGDPEKKPKLADGGVPSDDQVAPWRRRIAKNSKDYQALGELARAYVAAGDPLGAKLVLDKASEGGANADIYNLRGVVFHRLGYPQAAFEDFTSALADDETSVRARLNLAALYGAYGFSAQSKAQRAKVASLGGLDVRSDPGLIEEARR